MTGVLASHLPSCLVMLGIIRGIGARGQFLIPYTSSVFPHKHTRIVDLQPSFTVVIHSHSFDFSFLKPVHPLYSLTRCTAKNMLRQAWSCYLVSSLHLESAATTVHFPYRCHLRKCAQQAHSPTRHKWPWLRDPLISIRVRMAWAT